MIYKELPLTMNAKDVAEYLNISLSCAYQVMNSRDFPVIKAGKKLHTIFFQKQQGIYITPAKVPVREWLTEWLHNYAHINVRPSTYISYEGYINNHIIPQIGDLPIQKLTPPVVQNFYNNKFLNGRTDGKGGLSSKTLRNMHNMFHQAMEQAKIN